MLLILNITTEMVCYKYCMNDALLVGLETPYKKSL
jgi:hypothetical protein